MGLLFWTSIFRLSIDSMFVFRVRDYFFFYLGCLIYDFVDWIDLVEMMYDVC